MDAFVNSIMMILKACEISSSKKQIQAQTGMTSEKFEFYLKMALWDNLIIPNGNDENYLITQEGRYWLQNPYRY